MQKNNFNLEYFINGQNDPSPEMAAAFKKISKNCVLKFYSFNSYF